MQERTAEYYQTLFNAGYSTVRYHAIYEAVADIVSGKVLDMGCGTGDLKQFMPTSVVYKGFDFTGYAQGGCFDQGDIYSYPLGWEPGRSAMSQPCIYLVTGRKKTITRQKITAVLIAKNEEDHIRQALESVKDADEVIICDTGSTDDTVSIASEYGKVYTDYKWKGHFADARNHALSKCSGDWVLWMDADDHLAVPFDKVRDAVETHADAVMIRLQGNNHVHYLPWLHRNKKEICWKGAAHNYLVGAETQDKTDDVYVTLGRSINHKRDPDRTLNILKNELAKTPGLIREKYYLAREYWYKKDYITAKYWYEKYLKQASWKPEKADAHLMLARCLWNLQKGQEARVQCMEAVFINPDFKEALLFLSEMHYEPMKSAWARYAEQARNNDVLFIRG